MSTACSILVLVINLLLTSMSGAGLVPGFVNMEGTAVFSRLLRWANGDSSDKWSNVARPTETSVKYCKHQIG